MLNNLECRRHFFSVPLILLIVFVVALIPAWVSLGCGSSDKSTSTPASTPTYATQQQLDDLSKVVADLKVQIDTTVSSLPKTDFSKSIADVQIQINTLASQVSSLDASVSKVDSTKAITDLKVQVTNLQAGIDAFKSLINSVSDSGAIMAKSLDSLSKGVNDLKTTVTNLQRTSSTVIGATSINVNGLSVTFLNNNVYVPYITANTLGQTQLTVKITNNTEHDITNVDIVGTITVAQYLYSYSTGYPALADGASAVDYSSYYDGSYAIHFETYSKSTVGAKGVVTTSNLSIPKNGSLTLRPRIGLMSPYTLSATTITVALSAISYDTVQ